MPAEQHRPGTHRHFEHIIAYQCDRALSKGGVEKLAILFSIPAAFTRWGLSAFSVATFWSCLTNASSATHILICIGGGVSGLFLVTTICNGDWKLQLNADPLATGAKMYQLLKRVFVSVAIPPPGRLRSPRPHSFPGDRNNQGILV